MSRSTDKSRADVKAGFWFGRQPKHCPAAEKQQRHEDRSGYGQQHNAADPPGNLGG